MNSISLGEILLIFIGALLLSFLIYFFIRKPSNNRNWSKDQEILPSVSVYGDFITMHNVRHATYQSRDDYHVDHYDKTFKLSDLKKIWFLVEPFGPKLPLGLRAAHTLISFELQDGSFVSVSAEIRKKHGDVFNGLQSIAGIFREFEIMYVVADERDVIQLRTNHRKDDVRLYPLTIDTKTVQNIFLDYVEEINNLYQSPLFFHTILENCTTTIARHLRENGITLPRWHYTYILPTTLDYLFYKRGLIDTSLSLEDARKYFYITTRAQEIGDVSDFSQQIRSN